MRAIFENELHQRERRMMSARPLQLVLFMVAASCASSPERASQPDPTSDVRQSVGSGGSPEGTSAEVWSTMNHVRAIEERAELIRGELEALGAGPNDAAAMQRRAVLEKALEIARLEINLTREIDKFNARPRRVFVGSRSDSAPIRSYLAAWQTHLEKFGTDNMAPGVHGKVQLTMAIRPDGTLETVELNKSSGNATLDENALRIARLGAPYPRFSAEMGSIDVLHITRTWTFEKRGAIEAPDEK